MCKMAWKLLLDTVPIQYTWLLKMLRLWVKVRPDRKLYIKLFYVLLNDYVCMLLLEWQLISDLFLQLYIRHQVILKCIPGSFLNHMHMWYEKHLFEVFSRVLSGYIENYMIATILNQAIAVCMYILWIKQRICNTEQ